MADITLEQMLQAGVHFGHQTKYWNPKMGQHIFGTRDKIHIINLEHTVEMIKPALKFIEGVAAKIIRSYSLEQKELLLALLRMKLKGALCLMLMKGGLAACLLITRLSDLLLLDLRTF